MQRAAGEVPMQCKQPTQPPRAVKGGRLFGYLGRVKLNALVLHYAMEQKKQQREAVRASLAVPQYLPYPHKTIILEIAILFSYSSSSSIPLPFLVATNIFLISPQRKGEIQLSQYQGDHPNYHFSAIFSLTLLRDPHFI
jgi:hypothetical protein